MRVTDVDRLLAVGCSNGLVEVDCEQGFYVNELVTHGDGSVQR